MMSYFLFASWGKCDSSLWVKTQAPWLTLKMNRFLYLRDELSYVLFDGRALEPTASQPLRGLLYCTHP